MAIVATGYISALTAATATAAAQNARTAVECAIARRAARARATTAATTCARWSARALRRPRRPFTPAARRHHRRRRSRPRATRRAASCTALPFCRSRVMSLSRSGRQSAAWTRAAAAAAISHPHYRRLHRHLPWPTPWQSAHGGTAQAARPTYWCVWTAIDATGTMRGLDAAIATAAARSARLTAKCATHQTQTARAIPTRTTSTAHDAATIIAAFRTATRANRLVAIARAPQRPLLSRAHPHYLHHHPRLPSHHRHRRPATEAARWPLDSWNAAHSLF